VRAGDCVAIVAPVGAFQKRAEGFARAGESLGARAFIVTVPGQVSEWLGGSSKTGRTPLPEYPEIVELLKHADIVVDLVMMLFSREQLELQSAGVRVLMCTEPLPVLERMFPTPELRELVEQAGARLGKASSLRVTSAAGTDVTYALGAYPVLTEYGYTDTPGRWDNWPSGFVATHGSDDGVDGVIVLSVGDVLLTPQLHYVREPIRLTIRAGFITDIEGNGLDALLLRDALPPRDVDPDAYGISHIGWGLNALAAWSWSGVPGMYGMNQRSFMGCVMASTGPNTELGGSRDTPYHIDIPMRNCSLSLDNEPIVENGTVLRTSW
jgi:2,5-dihydroxypyridine 5,6-dioxygenase